MPFLDYVVNKNWQDIPDDLRILRDAEIIEKLGGCKAVADRFNLPEDTGTATVSNWKTQRGFPKHIKKQHNRTIAPWAMRWIPERRAGQDRRVRESRCRGYMRKSERRENPEYKEDSWEYKESLKIGQ